MTRQGRMAFYKTEKQQWQARNVSVCFFFFISNNWKTRFIHKTSISTLTTPQPYQNCNCNGILADRWNTVHEVYILWAGHIDQFFAMVISTDETTVVCACMCVCARTLVRTVYKNIPDIILPQNSAKIFAIQSNYIGTVKASNCTL